MFPIADRTPGPNRLTIFEGTQGNPGCNISFYFFYLKKKFEFFFKISQATLDTSASILYYTVSDTVRVTIEFQYLITHW